MVLLLHTWFLHRRLIANIDGDEAYSKDLQEQLFDRLWDDTTTRIRAQKLPEITVNKHLTTVQKYSFAACVSFDHAMTFRGTDKAKCLDELSGALWREVYQKNDKLTVDHVNRMGTYVDKQLTAIMKMPKQDFYEGKIAWIDPPDFKNVLSDAGLPLPDPTEAQLTAAVTSQIADIENQGGVYIDEETLPADWRVAHTEAGVLYYWNVETREAAWEMPVERKEEKKE